MTDDELLKATARLWGWSEKLLTEKPISGRTMKQRAKELQRVIAHVQDQTYEGFIQKHEERMKREKEERKANWREETAYRAFITLSTEWRGKAIAEARQIERTIRKGGEGEQQRILYLLVKGYIAAGAPSETQAIAAAAERRGVSEKLVMNAYYRLKKKAKPQP